MSVGDEDEDVDVEAAESDKASVGEHTPLQKITDTEEDRTSDRYYCTLLDTQCFIGTACILCICRVSVPLQQQKSSFDAMWAVPCLHTRDAAEHRLDYLIMHALSGMLYRFTKCGFSSLGFLRCSV